MRDKTKTRERAQRPRAVAPPSIVLISDFGLKVYKMKTVITV